MTNPIKIGIAGLGTVGIGVVKIIQQNEKILRARTGRKIEIVAGPHAAYMGQTRAHY